MTAQEFGATTDNATRPATLYVLVGIPGSGKSTFAAQVVPRVVSSDAIRLELGVDGGDASAHGRVFTEAQARLEEELAAGRDVVFDATNLSGASRRMPRALADRLGARLVAIRFTVDEAVARERNRTRTSHVVPEDVMDHYVYQFATLCGSEYLEVAGFEVMNPSVAWKELGGSHVAS